MRQELPSQNAQDGPRRGTQVLHSRNAAWPSRLLSCETGEQWWAALVPPRFMAMALQLRNCFTNTHQVITPPSRHSPAAAPPTELMATRPADEVRCAIFFSSASRRWLRLTVCTDEPPADTHSISAKWHTEYYRIQGHCKTATPPGPPSSRTGIDCVTLHIEGCKAHMCVVHSIKRDSVWIPLSGQTHDKEAWRHFLTATRAAMFKEPEACDCHE